MWLRLGKTKKKSSPTWIQEEKELNPAWRQKETGQDTTWRQKKTVQKNVSTAWRQRKEENKFTIHMQTYSTDKTWHDVRT